MIRFTGKEVGSGKDIEGYVVEGLRGKPKPHFIVGVDDRWHEVDPESVKQIGFESDGLVDKLAGVLKDVKIRIAFIGWPNELMYKENPDWRKEIASIEKVLAEFEKAVGG